MPHSNPKIFGKLPDVNLWKVFFSTHTRGRYEKIPSNNLDLTWFFAGARLSFCFCSGRVVWNFWIGFLLLSNFFPCSERPYALRTYANEKKREAPVCLGHAISSQGWWPGVTKGVTPPSNFWIHGNKCVINKRTMKVWVCCSWRYPTLEMPHLIRHTCVLVSL